MIFNNKSQLVMLALNFFFISSLVEGGLRGGEVPPQPPKTSRIVNGNMVEQGRFPYFARMRDTGCGGMLISKRFVLTAAHCVEEYSMNGFHIGAHNETNGRPVESVEVISHPSYSIWNYNNNDDIAIYHLAEDITDVPFVKLSPDMINEPGTSMTVMGLGMTDFYNYDSISPFLQKTDVQYVNSGECRAAYMDEDIDSGMMCANSNQGNDSCTGDSGGPLVITTSDNPKDDILVGVVSWGYGCGDSRYPGVYARISYYYDWIMHTMCDISAEDTPDYMNCDPPSDRLFTCGTKGAACHSNSECCDKRCDLFSNTCFSERPDPNNRPRGESSMGGAATGAAGATASSSRANAKGHHA